MVIKDRLIYINNKERELNKILQKLKFNIGAITLKEIKIACILDTFSFLCFNSEATLLQLTPLNWRKEIDSFSPDLLFIESAWRGKDELWLKKVSICSKELRGLVEYCKFNYIPTVFWNKEDPVHTDLFMPIAMLFDFVFTTDINSITKYKQILAHENVFHLHFGASPKMHNPVEKYTREDKFCFAGTYYHKYPDRMVDFEIISTLAINLKGLDIYDRNFGKNLDSFKFPDIFKDNIKGNLSPEEIDIAYKKYEYGVNMNSVKYSQTMFARRVFELIASNTIVISNYSLGLKNVLGELTICTDNVKIMENDFNKLCTDVVILKKYKLQGLRKIFESHLYEHRLSYIVKKVFNKTITSNFINVDVYAYAKTIEQIKLLEDAFLKQTYDYKKLFLITEIHYVSNTQNIIVLNEKYNFRPVTYDENIYLTVFSHDDYYGVNYLKDLVIATKYTNAMVIGKATYYKNDHNSFILNNENNAYKYVEKLDLRKSIANSLLFKDANIFNILNSKEIYGHNSFKCFSIDEFNYCENFRKNSCPKVDDIDILNTGLDIVEIQNLAEKISLYCSNKILYPLDLIIDKNLDIDYRVRIEMIDNMYSFSSHLLDFEIQYIYFENIFNIDNYIKSEFILNVCYYTNSQLDCRGVITFLDSDKQKVAYEFINLNVKTNFDIIQDVKYFTLGLRIKGRGELLLKSILFGE